MKRKDPSGPPKTLAWIERRNKPGTLRLLDQTRLPAQEKYLNISSTKDLIVCIKNLAIRGAPALGCAGAYGVVLAAQEVPHLPEKRGVGDKASQEAWKNFLKRCESVALARPTAVNLKWAVERVVAKAVGTVGCARPDWLQAILEEASAIHREDARMCAEIGRLAAAWVLGCSLQELNKVAKGRKVIIMTHCNAGALATGGIGTALAGPYILRTLGAEVQMFVGETRPLEQGARLTAWELSRAGLPVTVLCDGAAAALMRSQKPDAVIVGADRIAANGAVANKIGTYSLAVLAKHHGVRFAVAAPATTLDMKTPEGNAIPIEEREREELSRPEGAKGRMWITPKADVWNPAFDVTPPELITALITEKTVVSPLTKEALAAAAL
jgi:methylthioribose-1-phosphate isomerase